MLTGSQWPSASTPLVQRNFTSGISRGAQSDWTVGTPRTESLRVTSRWWVWLWRLTRRACLFGTSPFSIFFLLCLTHHIDFEQGSISYNRAERWMDWTNYWDPGLFQCVLPALPSSTPIFNKNGRCPGRSYDRFGHIYPQFCASGCLPSWGAKLRVKDKRCLDYVCFTCGTCRVG